MRINITIPMRALAFRAFTLAALYVTCVTSVAQTDPLDVWHQRLFPGSPVTVTGIAYGNGIFVAVGNNGGLLVSPDGITWTQYFSPPVIGQGGVIYGGGAFYAYGYSSSGGGNFILRSTDGVTWAKIYETTGVIRSAAYGNNRVVFVAEDRIITTTVTPTNWIESQLPQNTPLSGVTYGIGRFVACGYYSPFNYRNSYVLSSIDGVVWRYDYGPRFEEAISGIAYGNGVFVASWRTNSATDSGFLTSTNLSSWNYVPISGASNQTVGAVTFGGGQFIASLGNFITTSPDGLSWTNRPAAGSATAFAYGAGTFVTSGLRQSDVFANPTSSPPSNLALTMYPGVSVTGAEGQTYRIEASTNLAPGSVWQPLTNLTLPFSPYLWIDTSASASPRRFYRAVRVD